MLVGDTVDAAAVIHRALVLFSVVSCTLLLASFALFAHDQLAGASQRQTVAAASPAVSVSAAKPVRHHRAGQPRRFIDGAATTLTAPFAGVVSSDNPWVARGVPVMLGLLAYGLGVGMAARLARGGGRLGQ
jgi:hypothetical protein